MLDTIPLDEVLSNYFEHTLCVLLFSMMLRSPLGGR